MNSVDAEFVYRTLEGDFEAFGALVQRYQGMVYGVAYTIWTSRCDDSIVDFGLRISD